MKYIHDDFLLTNKSACKLYHEHAAPEPILDYHCHLDPREVATDRQFKNLFEIWLEGDHYKWRAMRCNGIEEALCTGDADPRDKFMAWARTVPHTLRNPLHHWTHLELQRYFGIDLLLNEDTAGEIWDEANRQLAQPEFSARGILKKFKVRALCTTDDPAQSLQHHETIAVDGVATSVYPTFRPDKALAVHQPEAFNAWAEQLAQTSGIETRTFDGFLEAIRKRHDDFHAVGGRLSDHGLERCYLTPSDQSRARTVFDKARSGTAAGLNEWELYGSYLMHFFGTLDAEKGWTKQLHLGAMRNNNSRLFREIGPDIGCDSIGDFSQGMALSSFLDRLEQEKALPRTILYNLNPADNYLFATMIGNFQDAAIPGKVQFGSGWWFLDQKEGMEMQINALSQLGLLSRFVGMLTDSRSFMSYPRHEYFRRVLCNLLGRDMESGEIPNDEELVGGMVRDICFHNAKNFLGLKLP